MRRKIPLAITFIAGSFMLIQFFIPHRTTNAMYQTANTWVSIIGGVALTLGIGSLVAHHAARVRRRRPGWGYSVVTFVGLISMTLIGLTGGIGPNSLFQWLFMSVFFPLNATMFALLSFYMASAAFRAFRARTLEATLLLVAAILVMIGRVPIGNAIHPYIPAIADWIMDIPNTAAKRAIMIG
ncbi:MAG TPA: hypothetical protein EYP17_02925, partial [Candidatus Latescibacteria bacterium]|nr:hypothetical protein [Candidatus Latescibacterota bacterium]